MKPSTHQAVAITGPESSGKSWLAEKLAREFQAACIPEFAREYLSGLGRPYAPEDLLHIAERQWDSVELARRSALRVVADTEMGVMRVWSRHFLGEVPRAIEERWTQQRFELVLLCVPDIPWEPDPLREHPEVRWTLFEEYLDLFSAGKQPFVRIHGDFSRRWELARRAVADLLGWEPL